LSYLRWTSFHEGFSVTCKQPCFIERYFCNYLKSVGLYRLYGSSCRLIVTCSITRFPTDFNRCKPTLCSCRIPNLQYQKKEIAMDSKSVDIFASTKFSLQNFHAFLLTVNEKLLTVNEKKTHKKFYALHKIAEGDYVIIHISVRPSDCVKN
jgi:hypothetical protein